MPERWGMTLRLGQQAARIGHDGLCEPPGGFEHYFDALPAIWLAEVPPMLSGQAQDNDPSAGPQNADAPSGPVHRKKRGRRHG
jgi:hypothetical protein